MSTENRPRSTFPSDFGNEMASFPHCGYDRIDHTVPTPHPLPTAHPPSLSLSPSRLESAIIDMSGPFIGDDHDHHPPPLASLVVAPKTYEERPRQSRKGRHSVEADGDEESLSQHGCGVEV